MLHKNSEGATSATDTDATNTDATNTCTTDTDATDTDTSDTDATNTGATDTGATNTGVTNRGATNTRNEINVVATEIRTRLGKNIELCHSRVGVNSKSFFLYQESEYCGQAKAVGEALVHLLAHN